MYVLRDDIFYEDSRKTILQKDPYKFFDIFLPIIPKLYFGNSANFFKSLFYDILIDEDFINLVAPFLYDYRKIYNVKNEFTIYYNSFEGKLANINNRNNTALLAFILYKVFFPAKYYELRYINEYGYHKSKLWDELHKKDSTHIKKDNFQLEDILKEYIQLDVLLIVMNVNLRYINLHGECLKESNFSGADLTGADFSGVEFVGADLRWANFSGSDFSGTDLRWANLIGANFSGADLTKANLTGADLINTKFVNNFLYLELPFELKNVILLNNDLFQFDEYVFNGKLVITNPIILKEEKREYIPYDMNKYKYNSKTNRMELKSNQSNEELLKK